MAPITFLSAYVINATDKITPNTTINVAIIFNFYYLFTLPTTLFLPVMYLIILDPGSYVDVLGNL